MITTVEIRGYVDRNFLLLYLHDLLFIYYLRNFLLFTRFIIYLLYILR